MRAKIVKVVYMLMVHHMFVRFPLIFTGVTQGLSDTKSLR